MLLVSVVVAAVVLVWLETGDHRINHRHNKPGHNALATGFMELRIFFRIWNRETR